MKQISKKIDFTRILKFIIFNWGEFYKIGSPCHPSAFLVLDVGPDGVVSGPLGVVGPLYACVFGPSLCFGDVLVLGVPWESVLVLRLLRLFPLGRFPCLLLKPIAPWPSGLIEGCP